MLLKCYACSKKGCFRENNEDNLYLNGIFFDINHNDKAVSCECDTDTNVMIGVFDGLGGEDHGEEASYKAAFFLDEFKKRDNIEEYFETVNREINNISKNNGSKRVGSTAAILSLKEDKFFAANIGDSRIYHIRDRDITMLSVDHTMTEIMIASGVITREDAEKSKYKNILTQCLGMADGEITISPYISEEMTLDADDIFVICSDGLSGALNEDDILDEIYDVGKKENIAEVLVDKAYEMGTRDNTTVIVIYAVSNEKRGFFNKFKEKLGL